MTVAVREAGAADAGQRLAVMRELAPFDGGAAFFPVTAADPPRADARPRARGPAAVDRLRGRVRRTGVPGQPASRRRARSRPGARDPAAGTVTAGDGSPSRLGERPNSATIGR
jgi:hypothetical protein